jgi:hypothetical protein
VSPSRLIITAAQLRAELDKMPPGALVAVEDGSTQGEDGPLGGVCCIGLEPRNPGLLVLAPYRMTDADKALFDAIKANDLPACLLALEDGANIEARDGRSPLFDGCTPLLSASGAPQVMRALLQLGADPNARSASGWTALIRACDAGHLESARLLLDAGAEPHLRTDEGYTAWGRIPGTCTELIALFRERGATNTRE